jgi:putative phosphoesterase
MKKIGLISDTHSYMDDRILHHLDHVDEIWHAGDIGDLSVTDALGSVAPVRAVYGNIDGDKIRAEFPLHQRFEMQGFKIWMTHIGGRPGRYDYRLRDRLFQERPDIFICGHSHICMVKKDSSIGGVYMNPGAAGRHGFHKMRTLLRFTLRQGELKDMEVVELGPRAKE